MSLKISCKSVGEYQQNAKILSDEATQKICVIDPGADIPILMKLARLEDHTVESVFLTHCHIDHGGGVSHLFAHCEKLGVSRPTLYYHSADEMLAKAITSYSAFSGFPEGKYLNVPDFDVDLKGVSTFKIGETEGTVFHVPGHAPGHVVLFFEPGVVTSLEGDFAQGVEGRPVLVGGDVLFYRSIGRTDLPGGNHETLLQSIREKVWTLPDETLVLTGHGRNTTIGDEKKHNPYF
jgi:hydroxyacylglutathione hydrolase